ncbi:MAG: DUF2313 domain-containing protein [candidate division Zixibacteria bacterium]|nr:DUF2313 domain-containing protein [candidate division Zixibacteria bacterium]
MIKKFSLEDHTSALADYLPNGRLFEAKGISDSNFRQLLRGLSGELFNAQGYLKTLDEEYIPDLTNLFLDEWEQALGIPDECFSGTGSNDDRRRGILVKLAALGVQTAQEFEDLGELFGVDVNVSPGIEAASFALSFPIIFSNSPADSRHIIVVDFPIPVGGFFIYNFPISFGESSQFILKCLFSKLRPANCKIIFRNI